VKSHTRPIGKLLGHATDDPYLFYSTDPAKSSRYVGAWAGGAAADEGA